MSASTCLLVCVFSSQLRREKIDLENTLEQEQELLVNRLWKRIDKVGGCCGHVSGRKRVSSNWTSYCEIK